MKRINILGAKASKPLIFFMHLPKTGGTSVDKAFEKHYKKDYIKIKASESYEAAKILSEDPEHTFKYSDCFRYRESLLLYQMILGSPFISGHIHFNQKIWEANKDKYSYISVLRHPVKRYISNFFYNKHKDAEHCRVSQSLSDFLESDRGRSWGKVYTNYFAGHRPTALNSDKSLLEIAKDNALKFDTIGLLEELETFVDQCQEKYNLTLKIPHERKNPHSKREVSQDELDKINHICHSDLELYNFIKENH